MAKTSTKEKKKKTKDNLGLMRFVYLIIGTILSVLVLSLSLMTIVYASEDNLTQAPLFLLFAFIALGLTRLLTFLKERTKISFFRFLVLFVIDTLLGVIVLFANTNEYLFSLVIGLYCVSIVVGRVFKVLGDRSIRNIVLSAIIATGAVLLAIGLIIPQPQAKISDILLVGCIVLALSSFMEVASLTLNQFGFKILIKIIFRTFALEVIFGLLACIAAFSLVLMRVEPNTIGPDGNPGTIATFPDALWYCFAVVTTIGFGDYTAISTVGRMLTVILGLYGIFVVAILTSIIVNFYNETVGKKDNKELSDIRKESEEDE